MKSNSKTLFSITFMLLVALSLVLNACSTPAPPAAAPTQDISMVQTQSAQTVVADLTKNAPPPATATEVLTGPTSDPYIPVAVVPTADPSGPSAVAKANNGIYSGPGTNYVLYGTFTGGQSAVVVGKSEDGQWWAINVPVAPTGKGWVSAGWVNAKNVSNVPVLPTPPVPETTQMVPPGPTDPQATTIANTYVRSGPATNYPAYGEAQAGVTARVIGKSEDGQWWVVRINPNQVGEGYGWVSGQYVTTKNTASVQTIQNPQTYTTAAPVPPASGAPSVTTTDYVNVRSGPSTNYPVLVVAPPNTTGEATGKSADGAWYQVKVPVQYSDTGLGWVSASYVIPQNTGSLPIVASPPPPPTVAPTPPPTTGTGCTVVSQSPADGTTLTIDTPFTTTWVLKNTGSEKWSTGEVDLRYVGAKDNVQLHTGSDLYDLAVDVKPGGTYNFSVPMIAPWNKGTYGEMWEVGAGSKKTICQFYIYINVP
ncbi:MAG: SH3 domain-containing protein [Bacteroidota bacterium]